MMLKKGRAGLRSLALRTECHRQVVIGYGFRRVFAFHLFIHSFPDHRDSIHDSIDHDDSIDD